MIVPSLSFIATANAVWQCGATPGLRRHRPADLQPRPGVGRARRSRRATKAIMPVHQVGLPADMDAFVALADAHGLALVEDAACAIGATYKGRPIGSLGPLACFSLHPRKVITTGEGGMITVARPERGRPAAQAAPARDGPVGPRAPQRRRTSSSRRYPERGWNCRMTDMQAALGLCQLEALDDILAERRRLAERYNAALARHARTSRRPTSPSTRSAPGSPTASASAPGAPVGAHRAHAPAAARRHRHAPRRDGDPPRGRLPRAPRVDAAPHRGGRRATSLMLPLFPGLTDEQQDYVIDRVLAHTTALAAWPPGPRASTARGTETIMDAHHGTKRRRSPDAGGPAARVRARRPDREPAHRRSAAGSWTSWSRRSC